MPTHTVAAPPEAKCETSSPADFIVVEPANRPDWCHVTQSVGYSLSYPAEWTVREAGAGGFNLMFNEVIQSGRNQRLIINFNGTELPLEHADEVELQGYGLTPQPLVDPSETRISRELQTVGEWQALALLTRHNGTVITRYFLQQGTALLMFEARTPEADYDTAEYNAFHNTLREVAASTQFTQ